MRTNQFDQMLEDLMNGGREAGITLKDGTVLTGRLKEFDGYVIVLEGEPMRMVYRHSILKLSEAAARVREQKPSPRPADRPRTAPAQKDRPPRPPRERRPEPERRPREKAQAEEHVPMGTMGEAMLKWLRSQKGGE